jgi:hypothetical protein
VTSLRAEQPRKLGSIPDRDKRFLSSSERLNGICVPPSLLRKGYLRLYLRWQAKRLEHETDQTPLSGAAYAWSYSCLHTEQEEEEEEEEDEDEDETDRHIHLVNTITSF